MYTIEETVVMLDDSFDYYKNDPNVCWGCGESFIPYSKELDSVIGHCYCSKKCYDDRSPLFSGATNVESD